MTIRLKVARFAGITRGIFVVKFAASRIGKSGSGEGAELVVDTVQRHA